MIALGTLQLNRTASASGIMLERYGNERAIWDSVGTCGLFPTVATLPDRKAGACERPKPSGAFERSSTAPPATLNQHQPRTSQGQGNGKGADDKAPSCLEPECALPASTGHKAGC